MTRFQLWVCVAAVAFAGPTAAQTIIRIDNDHTDIAVEYTGGAWRAQVRPDSSGPYTIIPNPPPTADRVHLVANPGTITTATASINQTLGLTVGQQFWHLKSGQEPGELYLGVSAQQRGSPPSGSWASWQPAHVRPSGQQLGNGQWTELQVKDVRGPAGGQVAVWLDTQGFGPDVYVSTAQRGTQDSRNAIYVLGTGHTHYNWGFTQPGVYEVDIDARSFYTNGELLSNPLNDPLQRFTFRFEVQPVPEPALIVLTGAGALGVVRWVRRRKPA